jgi:cAMP-dependent protein kinase regulator
VAFARMDDSEDEMKAEQMDTDDEDAQLFQARRSLNRRIGVSAESVDPEQLATLATRSIPKEAGERHAIKQRVQGNFLFDALAPEALDTVVDAMERKTYAPGDFVIRQGDDGDEFFLLASGECDCFIDFHDGKEPKRVKHYEPGESFGELSLMYNTPRAASIRACSSCQCWVLDRLTFRKVLMSTTSRKRQLYEDFLSKVPLLASMDKYERAKVADALKTKSFAAGEYIITAGDTAHTNFYILSEGHARATKVIKPGQEPIAVMEYGVGDYFGELALISGGARNANVVAVDTCNCVYIDQASFTRLLGPCEDILSRNQDNYEMIEQRLLGVNLGPGGNGMVM